VTLPSFVTLNLILSFEDCAKSNGFFPFITLATWGGGGLEMLTVADGGEGGLNLADVNKLTWISTYSSKIRHVILEYNWKFLSSLQEQFIWCSWRDFNPAI
jgi:hypothetical protein